MGLFSKDAYICTKCGKAFGHRFSAHSDTCPDCTEKELRKRERLKPFVGGYGKYAKDALCREYTADELQVSLN